MDQNTNSQMEINNNINNLLDKYFHQQSKKNKVLILTSIVGLLLFLVISLAFSFKNNLFNMLYPKPLSQATEGIPSGKTLKLAGTLQALQYVKINHADSLNLPQNFTIEAWVKPDLPSTPPDQATQWTIAGKTAGPTNSYHLGLAQKPNSDGSVSYYFVFGTGEKSSNCTSEHNIANWKWATASAQLATSWKHVAAVVNNGKRYLYEDGRLVAYNTTQRTEFCNSAEPLIIGARVTAGNTTDRLFQGEIDEVRISNIARYTTNLFTPAKTPFTVDSSTIALYRFNDRNTNSETNTNHGQAVGNISYIDYTPLAPTSPAPNAPTQEIKTWLITYKEKTASNPKIGNLTTIEFTKQVLLPAMNEGSKYHGYSNSSAQPALNYTLSDTDIHYEDNARPAKYQDLFDKYNLCNYAKANDIKAVIIWADGTYDRSLTEIKGESAITGNKGISTNGPVLPTVCDKTIVIYALDYTRGLAEALESYGHHLETVFRQFRNEYVSWADEAQNVMFRGPWFSEVTRGDSCGIDHDPPNAVEEYDRDNTADYQSDCRNWKPDGTGTKETLNCNTWGCSGDGWLKWWMQNMPGLGNTLIGTSGQRIPNWWVYIGDPDNCYNNALGCSGFTNPPPANVEIIYPNGGESFSSGTNVRITWQSSNVNICYLNYASNQLNQFPSPIATINNPAQGYYDWTVNVGNITADKQVKIDMVCDLDVDQSDNFFTVTPKANPTPTPSSSFSPTPVPTSSPSPIPSPTPQPTKPPQVTREGSDGTWCYDSDSSGSSATTKGYCQDNNGTYSDYCDNNIVRDGYCGGTWNGLSWTNVKCEFGGYSCSAGCLDGACKSL